MKKEDWEKISKEHNMLTIVGVVVLYLSVVITVFKGDLQITDLLSILGMFLSGLLFGFSCLDNELVREYERATGKKW